jgi:hypothetical protein
LAYKLRLTVDVDWVPDGGGTAFLGINQSNNPGYNSQLGPGAAGMAQTAELMIAEAVPGGDSPTLANFLTALQNAANDLAGTPVGTNPVPIFSQPGALYGQTGTPLSIIQGFASGNP